MASKSKKGKTIVSTLKNTYPPAEEKTEAKQAETPSQEAPAAEVESAEKGGKGKAKKPKAEKSKAEKSKKTSALDAAAKVLADASKPMNTKEMVDAMTAKGFWTSPNGLTPHATLYSAILREMKTKGDQARFKKAERGQFILA
jgi:hypothetical protein